MELYSQKSSLNLAPMGDELVMMDLSQGQYFGLNSLASQIWSLLVTPKSVDELVVELMSSFDVTEEVCRADTAHFLQQLVDKKLVNVTTAA
ncbi:PqqD family peptide modification chaperone [Shewanella sp. FJAT-51649]|uniref:PqqD family peptide modification chaperone n=1 Tax=Shewanella sp. FJAT-51649 TaxID=2864210 RepID=UPI001C6550F4|nr:PqqD family peptide modification chaperone [Shewanella sp. FJAT-51649]QYJ72812.1 PqqD family peptide modification chaperone [Shewanella sp. FJAT-51649]